MSEALGGEITEAREDSLKPEFSGDSPGEVELNNIDRSKEGSMPSVNVAGLPKSLDLTPADAISHTTDGEADSIDVIICADETKDSRRRLAISEETDYSNNHSAVVQETVNPPSLSPASEIFNRDALQSRQKVSARYQSFRTPVHDILPTIA